MDIIKILENTIAAFFGIDAAYFALAAIGLNIQFGYTGLLNFGQSAFMACGAGRVEERASLAHFDHRVSRSPAGNTRAQAEGWLIWTSSRFSKTPLLHSLESTPLISRWRQSG
jgi:hypothetical protein